MARVWADRRAYFLPLAVLLRACSKKATDEEIYLRIVADVPDEVLGRLRSERELLSFVFFVPCLASFLSFSCPEVPRELRRVDPSLTLRVSLLRTPM